MSIKRNRMLGSAALLAIVSASLGTYTLAEDQPAGTQRKFVATHSDVEAAGRSANLYVHVRPRMGAGKLSTETTLRPAGRPGLPVRSSALDARGVAAAKTTFTQPAVPAPGFYPDDLSYQGGPVLQSAETHNIYVNGVASDWGNPDTFLSHWQHSKAVHLLDQYAGSTADYRYPAGAWGIFEYPIFSTLGDNDLLTIVHAAAAQIGGGYGHVYNIFLPQGVDFCDTSLGCYSPDNFATFTFCAFHSSVDFQDLGHVLFTLEPYQNVAGCNVGQPSAQEPEKDSQASVLLHEMAETITDPDGTGWLAYNSLAVYGEEIGDVCTALDTSGEAFQSIPTSFEGVPYSVQFLYSNKYHACANVP
jgi:hypothetical protein